MSIHTLIDSPLCFRLGWTILHSVWQVLLLAILLAACLPALRRRGPQVSSIASVTVLLSCLLLPVMTFCLLPASTPTILVDLTNSASAVPIPPLQLQPAVNHSHLEFAMVAGVDGPVATEGLSADSSSSRVISDVEPVEIGTLSPVATNAPIKITAFDTEAMQRGITLVLPPIVALWLAGVLGLSVWNCGAWFAVQRLKMSATIPVTSAIERSAAVLAKLLGIRQAVRLLQSTLVGSPVVVGAFKPVILLPMSLVLELPPDQLEALLAHELAHILRRDYLVNLLQTAIETLLFYHPAIWWLSLIHI